MLPKRFLLMLLVVLAAMHVIGSLPATSGPVLDFEISLAGDEFTPEMPILLTMTLQNVSGSDVVVNKRLAVNDVAAPALAREVLLQVVHLPSGDEAPFGLDIKSRLPLAEDFTQLAPGETAVNTADIGELHVLASGGDYEVCGTYENTLSGPLVFDGGSGEFVEQDSGAAIASVESNCLTFTLVPPVGGIIEPQDEDARPLESADSSSRNVGFFAGIAAAITIGALALGGAAWRARRRSES